MKGLWQRLKLRLLGCVFLRDEKRPGWRAPLPIYEDYPHGHRGYFNCPECDEEWERNRRRNS